MSKKTGAKLHTHKYHRIGGLWACALWDCTHYMPKNVEIQLPGKKSICWNCGEEFTLNYDNMKKDQPNCEDCTFGFGGKASLWDVIEAKKEQERAKQKDNIEITEPTAPTGPTPEEERARKINTIRTYHDKNLGIGWPRTKLEKIFGHELVSAALDTQS